MASACTGSLDQVAKEAAKGHTTPVNDLGRCCRQMAAYWNRENVAIDLYFVFLISKFAAVCATTLDHMLQYTERQSHGLRLYVRPRRDGVTTARSAYSCFLC